MSASKPIELSVLYPFLEKAQRVGALTFQDAAALKAALDFLSQPKNESKDHMAAREKHSACILSCLIKGQSHGAYSLTEAAHIADLFSLTP